MAKLSVRPSCIREIPTPEELVMQRAPVRLPPMTVLMLMSSLWDWIKLRPNSGIRADMYSTISDWGVMG